MNIFLPSLGGMTEYFETEYAFMQLSVALYLAINGFLQLFIGPDLGQIRTAQRNFMGSRAFQCRNLRLPLSPHG